MKELAVVQARKIPDRALVKASGMFIVSTLVYCSALEQYAAGTFVIAERMVKCGL
jgi:hypothetical protein